ncbi:hypothetical protein LZ30DRAFT_189443 [Colletotrichum cereale]|nr:hypothetical protein LZ30DRAFT_189443 [Colletotrichum cereale]
MSFVPSRETTREGSDQPARGVRVRAWEGGGGGMYGYSVHHLQVIQSAGSKKMRDGAQIRAKPIHIIPQALRGAAEPRRCSRDPSAGVPSQGPAYGGGHIRWPGWCLGLRRKLNHVAVSVHPASLAVCYLSPTTVNRAPFSPGGECVPETIGVWVRVVV